MQETINKIVNLGIGTVKSVNEQGQDIFNKVQDQVNEWIAAGEAAADENSVKVKSFVEETLANIKNLEGQARTQAEELLAKVKELDPRNKATA